MIADVDQQRDVLVERLFSASLGMAEVLTVYLGDTFLRVTSNRSSIPTARTRSHPSQVFRRRVQRHA